MGQKLIIAPSARSDLHHIVQEIARDAPGRGANSATRSWIERSKQPIFPAPVAWCRSSGAMTSVS